ncbi:hypothetical protein CRG98_014459 [Punica granatum]|uniref:Uncharacterized protein n=1 Tax=Punica granatum TaxID=22663 RepID=A0A2I0K9C9_PUNGR|nr:hypothetical protein CRG98_014459 [Punica granatum]
MEKIASQEEAWEGVNEGRDMGWESSSGWIGRADSCLQITEMLTANEDLMIARARTIAPVPSNHIIAGRDCICGGTAQYISFLKGNESMGWPATPIISADYLRIQPIPTNECSGDSSKVRLTTLTVPSCL